jgi:hypothetical protein
MPRPTSEHRSPGSHRAISRCTYDAYEKSSLRTSSPNSNATETTSLLDPSRSSHSNSRSWSFPSGAAEFRLAARAPHSARARRRIVAATYGRWSPNWRGVTDQVRRRSSFAAKSCTLSMPPSKKMKVSRSVVGPIEFNFYMQRRDQEETTANDSMRTVTSETASVKRASTRGGRLRNHMASLRF